MVQSNINQKRRQKDVMKILVSGHKAEIVNEQRMDELVVDFHGPKDSPYVGVSALRDDSAFSLNSDNLRL